jgi:hypothetical protein
MAAWADIVELRLRIKDPLGVIAIEAVADEAARIAVSIPARQTAYLQTDTGVYYEYDAELATWEPCDLLVSDTRIGLKIDLYGIALAAPRVVRDIMAELGQKLAIVSRSAGADKTQYQTIGDMIAFYKALVASMEEDAARDTGTSSGGYFRTRRPSVAGGMEG